MKKIVSIGLFVLSITLFSCHTEKNDDGTTDSLMVDTNKNAASSVSSGSAASAGTSTTDSAKADTLAMSADPTRSQQ